MLTSPFCRPDTAMTRETPETNLSKAGGRQGDTGWTSAYRHIQQLFNIAFAAPGEGEGVDTSGRPATPGRRVVIYGQRNPFMHRLLIALLLLAIAQTAAAGQPSYTVVVSKATHGDAGWSKVVDALVKKHAAKVIVYDGEVDAALPELAKQFPRFTCFVATPDEAGKVFVASVHRLTRRLDDDPYTDTTWGILTGFDAANALAIAEHREPLTVRKVASGTELAMEMVSEGKWYCELVKGRRVEKKVSGEAMVSTGEADSTKALVDSLNVYAADLFVTSGHATERDWQIGYRYRNGYFKSAAGRMWGEDISGRKHPIASSNPKVYLPIGNCLMGHIDGPDAMALAWMNSAGVKQMIGYTVPTWYGYAGWGCLDYFVEQPGRYTFAEAFFANQHALIHRLTTCFPETAGDKLDANDRPTRRPIASEAAKQAGLTAQDGFGLLYDRDTVAFYGDPAWVARMATPKPGTLAYEQTLTEKGGVYTLEIKPNRGSDSFKPVNTNGAQRGWRPIVALLPGRVTDVEVIAGKELSPVIADDFILVPNPRDCDPARAYRVVFKAKAF